MDKILKFEVFRGQSAEQLATQLNSLISDEVENFEIKLIEFDDRTRVWQAIVLVWRKEVTNVQG